MTTRREQLKDLIENEGIIRARDPKYLFHLASGRETNYYVDMRKIILDWRAIDIIPELMSELVPEDVVYVGGVPTAGLLMVAPVIREAQRDRPPGAETIFGGFYVRNQMKVHGSANEIEGAWEPGAVACLLEDTVTTAGSILQAVAVARKKRLVIKYAICVFDREEGGREALAAEGIELFSVFKASEFDGLK